MFAHNHKKSSQKIITLCEQQNAKVTVGVNKSANLRASIKKCSTFFYFLHRTLVIDGLHRNKYKPTSVTASIDVEKLTQTDHRDNHNRTIKSWSRTADHPDGWFNVNSPQTRHLCVTKEETQKVEAWQLEEVWFITWFLQTSRLTLQLLQPHHFLNTAVCHFCLSVYKSAESDCMRKLSSSAIYRAVLQRGGRFNIKTVESHFSPLEGRRTQDAQRTTYWICSLCIMKMIL